VNINDQNEDHVKNFEEGFGLLSLVQVTDDFRDTADTQDLNHAHNFEEIGDVLGAVRSGDPLVLLIQLNRRNKIGGKRSSFDIVLSNHC
jgi:hypothetical protein